MKTTRHFFTLTLTLMLLTTGFAHLAWTDPMKQYVDSSFVPSKTNDLDSLKYDEANYGDAKDTLGIPHFQAAKPGLPDSGYSPTASDPLSDFVQDAYHRHNESDFAGRVLLKANVASSILSVKDHHHRVLHRIQPDFTGYFLAIREPNPRLEYIDAPFFQESAPYAPDAPLKEMVIIEVSGEIDFIPLDYEAFLFRFESPEGSCHVKLMDPVFPGVNSFGDDEILSQVFPECEGPQASRRRFLAEAVPELIVTGVDERTGTFLTSAPTTAATYSAPVADPGSIPTPGTGPKDGCGDYRLNVGYGWDSSEICSDLWWGYGNWVRGGNYWQNVTCIPEGDSCGVRTVNSGDNLHSSIRPAGWGSCQCCDNYGAAVPGKTASAYLMSDNGASGGHVAIAKTPMAWRTSTAQSVSSIGLDGQCGGDLDLPHHGSKVSAGGSLDYNVKESVQQNKARIGGWNAENIATHLCKSTQTKIRRKPGRVKPRWK